MEKMQVGYDAACVKEAYETRHPDRKVVDVCKDRANAMKTAAVSGGLVDLSYGFYVVTSAPT
ncbi:hypothetical protein [Acutalibacter muris]|uniref:hypothetical protein n=1 Tax=Acutalibacter muris TaxID=1796620 RepID=UPI00272D879D|nr:hypothetical protein [Acutalibacter muris]